MPLGSNVQRNIEELHESSKRPGTRMHALLEKYGRERFEKIAEAAAYSAARKHGSKE